jgi:hypothetical protein
MEKISNQYKSQNFFNLDSVPNIQTDLGCETQVLAESNFIPFIRASFEGRRLWLTIWRPIEYPP